MDNMTAKVSCFARAYHYRNNLVHVFADPFAVRFLSDDYEQIAQSMSQGVGFFLPGFEGTPEEGLRLIVERQLAPSVLGRSAFCEAMLEQEKKQGCRQYVIFAAGYDTYALRNRDPELIIYELDLPEMIADKLARTERTGKKPGAIYVPCDLSEASWTEKLLEHGFRRYEKSFCSLLGISYYLEKEAFRALLKAMSDLLCEGSSVCFDYPSVEDSRETKTNEALAQGAGEPMKARYDRRELEALLEECGFSVTDHPDHDEMTTRYFSAYNESAPGHRMEAPHGVCYVLAVKKTGEAS